MKPVGETNAFPLPNEGQSFKIGSMINTKGERVIDQALTANADLFAWTMVDLPRVDPRGHCIVYLFSKEKNSFHKRRRS